MKQDKEYKLKRSKSALTAFFCVFMSLIIVVSLTFIEMMIPNKKRNPYSAVLLSKKVEQSLDSITRVDNAGYLYCAEYYDDYYNNNLDIFLSLFYKMAVGGCTAFSAQNSSGDNLHARNYDFPHRNKEGQVDSLNVIVKTAVPGKYKTIAIADGFIANELGIIDYHHGSLDDGKTNITPFLLLPYICVDGMNEKGLSVSVEFIDIKDGETPTYQKEKNKRNVIATQLLRELLDNCANVNEAISYSNSVNMLNTMGSDYHLLVSDNTGKCVVLEWRFNTFAVNEIEACTNFYVGYDDACDLYEDGELKEKFLGKADTQKTYHYGYGHGYERFNKVVTTLESFNNISKSGEIRPIMSSYDCFNLLAQTRQISSKENQPHTMYSVVYNLNKLTLEVMPFPTYKNPYVFSL